MSANIMENPDTRKKYIIRKGQGKLPSAENNNTDNEAITKNVDKKTEITEEMLNARSKVFQEYFKMGSKKKIKIEDFAGIYRKYTIEEDKKRIEKFMNSREYRKPTPASVVLENVISELGESNNWFLDKNGNNEFFSCQLSEFDDKMADGARADMALEIKTPEGEIIRLLIDVTTSIDEKRLEEKRKKCTKKIEDKTLHSVKYFQSQADGKIGWQGNIPMVVVGMNPEKVLEFCGRAAENRDLSNDYVAFMLLDEIKEQLLHDYNFSAEKNGENDKITKILLKTYRTFSAFWKKKTTFAPMILRRRLLKTKFMST